MRLQKKVKGFDFFYCMLYMGLIISLTAIPSAQVLRNIFLMFSSIGFIFLILNDSNNYKIVKFNKAFVFILVVVVMIVSILAKDFFLISILLMGIAVPKFTDNNIRKILINSIGISTIVSVLTVSLCFAGMLPNIDTPRGWGEDSRFAWGFGHSQMFSILMFYSVMCYFSLRNTINIKAFIVTVAFFTLLTMIFDARTSIVSMMIFYILYIIKGRNHYRLFPNIIVKIVPVFMSITTLVLVKLYENGNIGAIFTNYLLSNRIAASVMNLKVTSLQILKIISYSDYEQTLVTTVDNAYLYIMLRYGILFLIIFFFAYFKIADYFFYKKSLSGQASLMAMGVSMFVVNSITGCYFLPFWAIAIGKIKNEIWNSYNDKFSQYR